MAQEKNENTQGFALNLTAYQIKNIGIREKGTFEDDRGKDIEYSEAISIDLVNVQEVTNSIGSTTVEFPLTVVIPCQDIGEAKLLLDHVKKMKDAGKPFPLDVNLPKKVKSSIGALEFINKHKL